MTISRARISADDDSGYSRPPIFQTSNASNQLIPVDVRHGQGIKRRAGRSSLEDADPASPRAFVSALLSRLKAEPGVESAAVAMGLPFTSDRNAIIGFRHEGQAEPESASMPTASMRVVSPEYFQMMRIPIRNGRPFDSRDTATSPEAVLINEQAAQRFFPGQNPVGQQIRVSASLARGARNGPKTIVGVVGDIKYRALDEDTPAEIYLPYEQHPVDAFTVAAHVGGSHRLHCLAAA
jgi:hypothetical protein